MTATRRLYRGMAAMVTELSGCKLAGAYNLTPVDYIIELDDCGLTLAIVYVSRRRLTPIRAVVGIGRLEKIEEIARRVNATTIIYVTGPGRDCPEGYERITTLSGRVCNACRRVVA